MSWSTSDPFLRITLGIYGMAVAATALALAVSAAVILLRLPDMEEFGFIVPWALVTYFAPGLAVLAIALATARRKSVGMVRLVLALLGACWSLVVAAIFLSVPI